MNVARQLRCPCRSYYTYTYTNSLHGQVIWPRSFLRLKPNVVRPRTIQTQIPKHNFNSRVSDGRLTNNMLIVAPVNKLKTVFNRSQTIRTLLLVGQQRFVSNVGGNSKLQFTISDINKNVPENILVFSHDNDSFYKFLAFFGTFQMILFAYFALSPVRNLRPGPIRREGSDAAATDLPWWKRWLYKEGQYKNAISGIFLTVGTSILFVSIIYPRRAVKELWLLKGGKHVKITTHSPFKSSQSFSVPLDNIDCLQARTGSATQIPLKIKDKAFFFLMDKQGTFHHSEMFDFVIGLKRKL